MKFKGLLICSLVLFLGNNVNAGRPIKKVLQLVKEIRYEMVDEIVEALAPLLDNCCNCGGGGGGGGGGDDGEGGEGVFLAGGVTSQEYRTEAFYNTDTNELCEIPPMSIPRQSSTTTGFTVCGGIDLYDYDYQYNCETFDPMYGTWDISAYFEDLRANHVAWQSSMGLYLISGWGGPYNSTFIPADGSYGSPGFDVPYAASYGCAVADPDSDSVIVIGGYDYGYSINVTRYNDYGFVESLPPLNVGRVYAGCSGYYNDAGNLVLVVTGGAGSYWPIPTETLEVGVDSYWNWFDEANVMDIGCASANNGVYCFQGWGGYNVTEWNTDTDSFDLKLDVDYWRGYFGNFASSVPADSGVGDWCMSYKEVKQLKKNVEAPERKELEIKEKK